MKDWVKKILLVLVAIIVGLIIGEIVSRVYYHLTDSGSVKNTGLTRHIKVQEKKNKNTLRIVFIGDSYTYGSGLRARDTFVKVSQRLLAKELKDSSVECLNFSRRGANSVRELRILKNRALKFDPDLIILGFVLNDFSNWEHHRFFTKKWTELNKKYKPLLKLEKFSRLAYYIDAFIFKVGSGAADVHIDNLNSLYDSQRNKRYQESYSALEEIISIISRRQGLVLFFPYFMKDEDKHFFYQEGKRLVGMLCQKYQIPFMEVLPFLKDKPFYKWWLNRENHHPNKAAHSRIGKLIAAQIKKRFLTEPTHKGKDLTPFLDKTEK